MGTVRRLAFGTLVAMLLCLSTSAAADAKTVIFTQAFSGGFEVKPEQVGYRSPYLPGASITIRGLRWSGWGGRTATAGGRVKLCPNMSPCDQFRAPIEAKGLYQSEGETKIYSKLKVRRKGGDINLCIAGEVCG